MRKVESTLSQFDRDLMASYGSRKFFIYYHWKDIINDNERFRRVALEKVAYEGERRVAIYLRPSSSGSAVKLRHCLHELEEQIRLKARIGREIEIKLVLLA